MADNKRAGMDAHERSDANMEGARTPDVSHISNPDVAHEVSDVSVPAIFKFVAGLTVSTVIVFILVWGLLSVMSARLDAEDAQNVTPMTMKYGEQVPPKPYLQLAPYSHLHPLDEYKLQRDEWDATLKNGGQDKEGSQRIPIEQAKQALLQQGVPTRKQDAAAQNGNGTDDLFDAVPSYQSSGQQTERRKQ